MIYRILFRVHIKVDILQNLEYLQYKSTSSKLFFFEAVLLVIAFSYKQYNVVLKQYAHGDILLLIYKIYLLSSGNFILMFLYSSTSFSISF